MILAGSKLNQSAWKSDASRLAAAAERHPYVVALVTVTISSLVRWQLSALTGDLAAFLPYTPALMISAYLGGLRGGLLATGLGALVGNFLWQKPAYTLGVAGSAEAVSVVVFLLAGSVISGLSELLHQARREAVAGAVEVRESRAQLRELLNRLDAAREAERTAVAREIHDEVGQILTLVKLDLQRLFTALRKDAPHHAGGVEEALELVDGTIDDLRDLCARLRPPILDHVGLAAALEWQAQQFATRTGIACRLECDGDGTRLSEGARTALFRIFQEALTNAGRHSGASEVRARYVETAAASVLEVSDDGCGFDTSEVLNGGGLGMAGIQERALALGGSAEVHSRKGEGARWIVEVPLVTQKTIVSGAEE
jgi:signal transduction histidine kinase